MINIVEKDKKAFELACNFLNKLFEENKVDKSVLEKYLKPGVKPESLNRLYMRFLESAKNRNMMTKVINSVIGDIENLDEILENFNPQKITKKYPSVLDWKLISNKIIEKRKPKKKPRTTNRSLWPQFCKSIISSARFLSRFQDQNEFYAWLSPFDTDDITRASVAMLLSYEIDGFGFPLACDFLKEIGYENFGKPDVYLIRFFDELKLCESKRDYDVFKAVLRLSKNVCKKPYEVDKIFWLIGSGYFYLETPELRLGQQDKEFIKYAKKQSPELFG